MHKTLLVLIVLPSLAFGQVTVHKDEFKIDEASNGVHFWGRLYDWNAWAKTDKHRHTNLSTNFVKQAFDADQEEYEGQGLDEDQVLSQLGSVEGAALYDFYDNREEVDPEDIGRPSGLVTVMKAYVDLPESLNLETLSLEVVHKLISKADKPHLHTEVSGDFVREFVDPLHSAHAAVAEAQAGKFVLSTVNTGSDYYSCPSMNAALTFKGELEGISSYDGNFRAYLINSLRLVDHKKKNQGKGIVEGEPVKVFEQKVIYSSTLIKSGVNYLAFYSLPNGRSKMAVYSFVVSTSKVKEIPGNFVNGINLTNDIFSGIKFEGGQAVLDQSNLDLSPLSGNCSNGLAQGLGRYVLNLAESISKWSLIIK